MYTGWRFGMERKGKILYVIPGYFAISFGQVQEDTTWWGLMFHSKRLNRGLFVGFSVDL